MKEQTYGWYPSQKDVYKDRRMGAPNAYRTYITWLGSLHYHACITKFLDYNENVITLCIIQM